MQTEKTQAQQDQDREQAKLLRLFIAVVFAAAHIVRGGTTDAESAFKRADSFIAAAGLEQ